MAPSPIKTIPLFCTLSLCLVLSLFSPATAQTLSPEQSATIEKIIGQGDDSSSDTTRVEATEEATELDNGTAVLPATTEIKIKDEPIAVDAAATEDTPLDQDIGEQLWITQMAESFFASSVDFLSGILFFEIAGFPFIVLWLICGGIFFTLRLGFVNIRMFGHALNVVRGKYDHPDDPGEVSHFEALSAAVSATVGLGNIAGVAVAIALGGPGAVIWMVIAGFMAMSTKFAEVTLGHKYRSIDANGRVMGGAFRYLELGIGRDLNKPKLGKFLAVLFAFLCLGGSLGAGNMFQANQTVEMFTNTFPLLSDLDWVIALVMAIGVGTVLIGGIRRIAQVAEAVVPTMAIIYVTAALVVIIANREHVPEAVSIMFSSAFDFEAFAGGALGAIIMGFRRAAFSNEAGFGSAPIAHAAAKTTEAVREGCVAILEPFLDTVVICFMSGIVIVVTGVYIGEEGMGGVVMTSRAFATVIDWFPMVLSLCIMLFAFSTMLTWSYYGERAWNYIFGSKLVRVYYVIFCSATFFGGISNFGVVLDLSDLLVLAMALPNVLGLYMLSGIVSRELKIYTEKLKSGQFVQNA